MKRTDLLPGNHDLPRIENYLYIVGHALKEQNIIQFDLPVLPLRSYCDMFIRDIAGNTLLAHQLCYNRYKPIEQHNKIHDHGHPFITLNNVADVSEIVDTHQQESHEDKDKFYIQRDHKNIEGVQEKLTISLFKQEGGHQVTAEYPCGNDYYRQKKAQEIKCMDKVARGGPENNEHQKPNNGPENNI